MTHYSIIAAILFDTPMTVSGVREPVEGFTQTVWVTAGSFAEAVGYIEREVDEGRLVSIEGIELSEGDLGRGDLEDDVDLETPGVFHRFDRAFFGPVGSGKRWWEIWKR